MHAADQLWMNTRCSDKPVLNC